MTCENESDEEIRERIIRRLGHILERPPPVYLSPPSEWEKPDAEFPHQRWHKEGFAEIEALREQGKSINEACHLVGRKICERWNIELLTVEVAYRRHRREYYRYEFKRCMIMQDLDGAVKAYKQLTKPIKQELGLI